MQNLNILEDIFWVIQEFENFGYFWIFIFK